MSPATASCVLMFDWGVVVVRGCRERSGRSVKLRASLVTAVSRSLTTVTTFNVSFRAGLLSLDHLLGSLY